MSMHRPGAMLIAASLILGAVRCSQPLDRMSFIPTVEELQSIDIQDVVRSPQSVSKLFPIEARYALRRGTSGFVGPATFSVGSSTPRKATANILLPFEAVRQFLQPLAGLSLRDGYEPATPPPGGAFPDIRIELEDQARRMTLLTRSPGRELLPWGVEFDGRTYTIESNIPPKAFAALQPYLKRDVLDTLTQSVTSPPAGSGR